VEMGSRGEGAVIASPQLNAPSIPRPSSRSQHSDEEQARNQPWLEKGTSAPESESAPRQEMSALPLTRDSGQGVEEQSRNKLQLIRRPRSGRGRPKHFLLHKIGDFNQLPSEERDNKDIQYFKEYKLLAMGRRFDWMGTEILVREHVNWNNLSLHTVSGQMSKIGTLIIVPHTWKGIFLTYGEEQNRINLEQTNAQQVVTEFCRDRRNVEFHKWSDEDTVYSKPRRVAEIYYPSREWAPSDHDQNTFVDVCRLLYFTIEEFGWDVAFAPSNS